MVTKWSGDSKFQVVNRLRAGNKLVLLEKLFLKLPVAMDEQADDGVCRLAAGKEAAGFLGE